MMVVGALAMLSLGGASAGVTIHDPQVVVLPLLLATLPAWGLSLGDEVLLPVLAFTGPLVVQADIVYAPFVVAVGVWAPGAWWLGLRGKGLPARRRPRVTHRRAPGLGWCGSR